MQDNPKFCKQKKDCSPEKQAQRALCGRRISERRLAVGITSQKDLGARIGVHYTTIGRWEKGEIPHKKYWNVLTQALTTNMDYLLGHSNDPTYTQTTNTVDGQLLGFEQIRLVSQNSKITQTENILALKVAWDIVGLYPVAAEYLRKYSTLLEEKRIFAMRVNDRGMMQQTQDGKYSVFTEGDHVIFSFGYNVNDGDTAVVYYKGGFYVRVVSSCHEGTSSDTVLLEAANRDKIVIDTKAKNAQQDFCIIGKVLYILAQPQEVQSKYW